MTLATRLFDYELPEKLIAQYPAGSRDASRMLVLDRNSGQCELRQFADIVNYLEPGDGLIFNNTRVMNARMYGIKNGSPGSARIELLLVSPHTSDGYSWNALVKPGKRVQPGTRIKLLAKNGSLPVDGDWVEIKDKNDDGSYIIRFDSAAD
ncbi:MAG: S-adenosylmethionine:tRNA ribosyltransferase-isomerase, partial [Victivallales bacterium]|nr:S-adenosylmethionine:tRNA ribosyltransferase-isomerase [Victivallales bacterium]